MNQFDKVRLDTYIDASNKREEYSCPWCGYFLHPRCGSTARVRYTGSTGDPDDPHRSICLKCHGEWADERDNVFGSWKILRVLVIRSPDVHHHEEV